MRGRRWGDGAAAVVQVDEDEVVDGGRGREALRRLEGGAQRAGRELHLVEDALQLLLPRGG